MTATTRIWPTTLVAEELLPVCSSQAPALLDVLNGPFPALGLQVTYLDRDNHPPLVIGSATWLKRDEEGLSAPPPDVLTALELLAMAQVSQSRDLLPVLARHFPRIAKQSPDGASYSALFCEAGVILHALDLRSLARNDAGWRATRASSQPLPQGGEPSLADFDAAMATLLPFAPPPSSTHERLRQSSRAAALLSTHLERVSLLLPSRCRVELDPDWHLPNRP